MEAEEALELARVILATPYWELISVRRLYLPASTSAPNPGSARLLTRRASLMDAASDSAPQWVVEVCYHAQALRWDEMFILHSWADWVFVRDAQPARLARRVALVQARRPYLPGAPGAPGVPGVPGDAPASEPLQSPAIGAPPTLRGAPARPEREGHGDGVRDRVDLEPLVDPLDDG